MNANHHREDTLRLAEQAWEWLERLEEAGPQVRAEFAAWLSESPRHVEEFLLATSVHREFEGVDAERRIDVEGLLAAQRANVVSLPDSTLDPAPRESGHKRRRRQWISIAAGVMCFAIAGSWLYGIYPQWLGYSTGTGEQRTFELQDGSIVHLNTRSRIRVTYSGSSRDVKLVGGEALFQVARQPDRPFRVHAGGAVIQAVGTQFNVYRRAQDTSVAVLEGTVRVSTKDAALFTAGQGASIAPNGKITRREAADTEKVSAWRQRRLVFRGEVLADVATEFNRYNRSLQIRVEGTVSRTKKLTGVFNADDPELLLKFLREDPDLRIEQTTGQIVVYPRSIEP